MRIIRRDQSAKEFAAWLSGCGQPLLISSPPYTGKSCFVQQLSTEEDFVALHSCHPHDPASLDHATLLRNIATQLVRRFPNVVLPYLSTVTLLADLSTAVDHYLALPLASLPLPPRPLFIIIDDIQPPIYDLVFKLQSSLPSWLKLVVTSRSLPPHLHSRFSSSFHELHLSSHGNEIRRFVHERLPQCHEEEVVAASQGSWFFVDQLARALEYGMLLADEIPLGTENLLAVLSASPVLPNRLNVYLMLLKSSRRPPSHSDLLSVAQILVHDVMASIQKDLEDLSPILSSTDPVILSGSWVDFEDDLAPFHSAWAEHFKLKKRKSPQDLVELAFHLAHSGGEWEEGRVSLSSLGASSISLRCPVVDEATSDLLHAAGAAILRPGDHEDFVLVCSRGEVDRVGTLLPSASPSSLSLGLLAAASRGHVHVCRTILDTRPEVMTSSSSSEGHWNGLRAAACGNHVGVVELLMERGVAVDECGKGGRTALRAAAWAGHSAIVACLLKARADIEKKDSEGRTALMAAAFMENHSIVEDLLRAGARVNEVDSSGATALHLVLSNGCKGEGHRRTVSALMSFKADVNVEDSHGRGCLHLAAYHGDDSLEAVARFSVHVDGQDGDGRTPLMLAASQGQAEAVQILVSRGADIDAIDNHGRTSLLLAAINGHVSIVDILLSLGADEIHKDDEGGTALHYAVCHPSLPLTRSLISPSTVHATDAHGNHPLIVAAQHPHEEVVAELISAGSSVEKQSLEGLSALRVAALAGHCGVVRVLAPHIADWEQRDLEGTPLLHSLLFNNQVWMSRCLLDLGASVSSRDSHGRLCSHVVASRDDVAGARLLHGQWPFLFSERDEGGRSPLITAVWAGHVSMVAFLLEAGVDPNGVDSAGASALSVAAQLGQREILSLLLRFGADPSLKDKAGRTAHDVARLSGKEKIGSVLKSATGSADSSGFGSMPPSPLEGRVVLRRPSLVAKY